MPSLSMLTYRFLVCMQLDRIFCALGTPNETVFPGISDLPEYKPDFHRYPVPKALSTIIPSLEHDVLGMDLISQMLCYDPNSRIAAQDAMQHAYFREINNEVEVRGAEEGGMDS